MKTFGAREAKNGFGRLLDTARGEPVTIAKKGRPVAVMLSIEDYEHLQALEDAWWGARAAEAEREGSLGPEEGEELLRDLLRAED